MNKSRLGANAMIGVSVAIAKAAAKVADSELFEYLRSLDASISPSRSLPYLYMNLINGGKHATSRLAFQEYHIVPIVDSVSESLAIGVRVQEELEKLLLARFGPSAVHMGDEGGFALDIESVRTPLELLKEVVTSLGLADKIRFALDVAASSFFDGSTYLVDGKNISSEELLQLHVDLIREFNLISVEDPFQEEDFSSFAKLQSLTKECMIIGDDLTVTNVARLDKAITEASITGIIIKPNQIGTLTETIEAIARARRSGIHCVVSHRSGETSDSFIADLAAAFGCFGIKAGAPRPAERLVKYDRLCAIERLGRV
jgi:enolase